MPEKARSGFYREGWDGLSIRFGRFYEASYIATGLFTALIQTCGMGSVRKVLSDREVTLWISPAAAGKAY